MTLFGSDLKQKIVIVILLLLASLAAASSVYNWYEGQKKPPTPGTWITPKPIVQIKYIKVPGPKEIQIVEKKVIVEKIKLPDWVKTDDNLQGIATAIIEPYKGKTNVVTLLNMTDGKAQILTEQQPLALFGFVNDREVGIRAGINIKGEPETTVYGKWSFVRVGNVHVGVYGDAGSTGTAKVQLEAGFRF